jgi:hypothetical protein
LIGRYQKFRLPLRIQFTFKMIPTFQRVVKRPHRVYTHKGIDHVLNYLTQPEFPRGAIPQVSRDTGIPCQIVHDWHKQRTQEPAENGSRQPKDTRRPEHSAVRMKLELPISSR